jgi:hypothetical protein
VFVCDSGCRGLGNYGKQLGSALVWQGAKFVAVQDDALLVGVDDLWAYVSMRPDGPYNGLGCVLSDMPPHTRPGHCAAALNGTVLPDGVRCSLGEAASCCIATIDRDTGQQLGS